MTATPVQRSLDTPVWRQVEADLKRRLAEGEFALRLPSELALAEQYGVSRHTIRQALRGMRESGAVDATRGRASRPARPAHLDEPLGALYGLLAAAEAAGLRVYSTVRTLAIRADGVVARGLSLEESTPLVLLDRVRWAGETPLALDRIWMPAVLGRPLLDVDFRQARWYAELVRRAGVRLDRGEEQIRAVVPAEAQRRILKAPEGTAAFLIRQVGRVRGVPVVCRQVLVRGDRFGLRAEFDAVDGYRLQAAEQGGWERR